MMGPYKRVSDIIALGNWPSIHGKLLMQIHTVKVAV